MSPFAAMPMFFHDAARCLMIFARHCLLICCYDDADDYLRLIRCRAPLPLRRVYYRAAVVDDGGAVMPR